MSAAGIPAASPDCTICICTRNRVRYLGPTIEAALKQELPNGRFEILVVDNGSTDGTSGMVAERFRAGTRAPVRCIREETPGLSRARNRAIAETASDILLFLDDDAIPEPGWLAALADAFASAPDIDVVGGAVIPVYEGGRPDWFPARAENIFHPNIQAKGLQRVYYPHYPYGANIAFRRSVFSRVGLFREDLGYRGNSLMPAEETELLLRIEKSGGRILYEPKAIVRHLIPASRTSRSYLRRRYFMMGRGHHELEKTRRHDIEPWGGREIIKAFSRAYREYNSSASAIRALNRAADKESFDRELQAWVAKGRAFSLFQEVWVHLWVRLTRPKAGR